MNQIDKQSYEKECEKYKSLGANLKESLKVLLADSEIKCLDIQYRIKKYDSFTDKIEEKKYSNPWEDVEDVCGVRIICYYLSDVKEIGKIIEKEFNIINSIDKEDNLDADRFGYRSKHYVVSVKDEWLRIPNYRNSRKLKAEIQVRTILMHAWAEIEHELCYKSEIDVPIQLRRKLNRLSALIEIADEQFEQVRNDKKVYVDKVIPKQGEEFDLKEEMNVDTLQAFLDVYMPKRARSKSNAGDLLKELVGAELSFSDILDSYKKSEKYLAEASKITRGIPRDEWAQVGAVRLSLELTNNDYWDLKKKKFSGEVIVRKFEELRGKINK